MSNKVSVVIPSYNCAQYLSRAINSVLQQSYSNFEIIIVDDGSTDNTGEIIASYNTNEKIKYFYQSNGGVSTARNAGIRNSSGEYIAFLDADDYWAKDKLEKQMKVFMADRNIKLVHSNIFVFTEGNEEQIHPLSVRVDFNRLTTKELFIKILFWEVGIHHSTVVFEKKVWELLGGFDEKLSYLGCEDREFQLRLLKEYNIYFLKDCLAYYMSRHKSISKNIDNMHKARMYVIDKTVEETEFFKKIHITKKKVYSKLFLRYGIRKFRARVTKEAISDFKISIGYYPFNLQAYIYIFCCLLPVRLIDFLSKHKAIFLMEP